MSEHRTLRLLRISRTVSNLEKASAFYHNALDFRIAGHAVFDTDAWGELMGVVGARGASVTMRLGEQELELVAFDPPGSPYPPVSDSSDLWFQHIAIVVGDLYAAYARLLRYPVTPISDDGPQRLPPSSGSVMAYKFRDPDGHPLELIQFPAGRGHAAWQKKDTAFLGIDHSAIDVADIDPSVDFYTRLLGFNVASRSVNSGPAQQRLDHLHQDIVDVVALQAITAAPPHVELLAYRKPQGHRIPPGTRSNDICADRLVLQVGDLARLVDSLRAENVEFVSPGVVALSCYHQAALIRDPTGHLLLLSP